MSITYGVSLYSFQEDYLLGKRDLEGCIAGVTQEIGAPGIELLLDQMPLQHFYENDREINDADLDFWNGLMDKYKAVPISYSADVFTTMFSNRTLTDRENKMIIAKDMRAAARLGFPVYRTGIFREADLQIFEDLLPLAEELGIQIATEIHTPRGIHTWYTQKWLEIILRTGSRFAGFVPDFAIFTAGMTVSARNLHLRKGAKADILDQIDQAYRNQVTLSEDDIRKMGGGEAELFALQRMNRNIYDNPEWLKEVLPYTRHIHGKLYEMNSEGVDPSIDYENAVRVLVQSNWSGSIASEYEGQRDYYDRGCDVYMDPVDQCRRQHDMIKSYVKKYQK